MKPKKVHCLFEQSGTFKKQFIDLGIPSEDYDILDDFGQTDHMLDLFSEIEKAYRKEISIFDSFDRDDLIIAFFPCTRFEVQIIMAFKGNMYQQSEWDDIRKLEYSMKLHNELNNLYILVSQLVCVCVSKGLRLIIENPYSDQHYLHRYWPIEPSFIDYDRRMRGDYFKKPTQYWFINCKPEQNMVLEPQEINGFGYSIEEAHRIHNGNVRKVNRSLLHGDYARRFILEFIMDSKYQTIKA